MTKIDPQEYAKIYKEYLDNLDSAYVALATHGMDSVQFTEADARAGLAYKSFREIHAHHKGGHWSV